MITKYSKALNIPNDILEGEGVFDGIIEIDSRFFIDPILLRDTNVPELSDSYQKVLNHFSDILSCIRSSSNTNDRFWRKAIQLLMFKEPSFIGLGYGRNNKKGKGIGLETARKLALTAKEIIDAGTIDPAIFLLIGLFEEGIGPDKISDMITRIIIEDLFLFNKRVISNIGINNTKETNFKDYSLPVYRRNFIFFIPRCIIKPLPTIFDKSEIDIAVIHNRLLRHYMNNMVGEQWKKDVGKNDIKREIINNPNFLREILKEFKLVKPRKYDFGKDPFGEYIWFDIAKKFTKNFPLDLAEFKAVNKANVGIVVKKICDHFSGLFENNGLSELIYSEDSKLRHERFVHLLFFAIADAYCEANDIDLTRESNAGNGAVDFKLSYGYSGKAIVEIKYSSNSNLVNGYKKQLEAYIAAENPLYSIYLIILVKDSHMSKIETLLSEKKNAMAKGLYCPDIVVINGFKRETASKLR